MSELPALREIVTAIKSYPGLTRKAPVRYAVESLAGVTDFGQIEIALGDDAAAIATGDSHLLLAVDAIMPSLLEADPYWAGYCAVLVNVNDIFAMGGQPLAMVNTLAFVNEEQCRLVLAGVRDGCQKFGVPMVGGHTVPDAAAPVLAVSIVGTASRLLTSFTCKEGDALVLAMDLDGQRRGSFLHWDTTSRKTTAEIGKRLQVLPLLADRGLANAAKDISNPGILGTVGMLLETSRKGAVVDVASIPRPGTVSWIDWLRMYPGFGFVMSLAKENVEEVRHLFRCCGIAAEIIGEVTTERQMWLSAFGDQEILFDFEREQITGIVSLSGD